MAYIQYVILQVLLYTFDINIWSTVALFVFIHQQLEEGKILPKKNQLRSTNLSHLDALLYTAESFGHVTALLHPVHYETDDGYSSSLIVDVVGHEGRSWVKVTARKAEALHRIWEGQSNT